MTIAVILVAVVCLAYANGANDNFKGVATLFGSGTTNYHHALWWATVTTLLGSMAAVLLAGTLLKNFSGRGLVSDRLAADPTFAAAVALGAALTVLIATRIGMPVSTTHSLVGALVGAGAVAGSAIHAPKLAGDFFLPLLASPFLAIALIGLCYPGFRSLRQALGVTQETCLCAGREVVEVVSAPDSALALQRVEALTAVVSEGVTCRRRYSGRVLGITASAVLDRLHYLSAGMVSFARGLNDTPKIAGLLLLVPHVPPLAILSAVGIVIALGGLVSARRVAEVMGHRITGMNPGQAFTANLATGVIVIGASRFGLPVSTTHVSCGSLFGLGAVTGQAHWRTIARILLAWITTLPLAAVLAGAAFWILSQV